MSWGARQNGPGENDKRLRRFDRSGPFAEGQVEAHRRSAVRPGTRIEQLPDIVDLDHDRLIIRVGEQRPVIPVPACFRRFVATPLQFTQVKGRSRGIAA
jgi:hypothetical protein